jgi:hypothetical protein
MRGGALFPLSMVHWSINGLLQPVALPAAARQGHHPSTPSPGPCGQWTHPPTHRVAVVAGRARGGRPVGTWPGPAARSTPWPAAKTPRRAHSDTSKAGGGTHKQQWSQEPHHATREEGTEPVVTIHTAPASRGKQQGLARDSTVPATRSAPRAWSEQRQSHPQHR